jgi:hypothetical protein
MKHHQWAIPFAVTALAASLTTAAFATPVSPPTGGAYLTDKQNSWVQDRVGDRVGTVNMIMCIIGAMRGDAMVNQGPYVALIDQSKCEGRGDSSKSTSTNAGASNVTDYTYTVVESSQASDSAPLVMKAWLHDEQGNGGSPVKVTIYAYVVATEGKSDTHPNGLFSMYFCAEPNASPGTCVFTGALKSDETGLSFYEQEGSQVTNLKLATTSTDAGSGKVSGTQNSTPYNYTFAYDTDNFRRKEGSSPDVCFDRRKDHGETSTWRYGTYDSTGARLDLDHPGFPVKYINATGDTYYGFWSFWGLWLPDSAMTAIANGQGVLSRRNGGVDEAITPISKGGKLWRLSRHTSTLGEMKNVSVMYWSNAALGTTDGSTPAPANTSYELKWVDGALSAVGYQVCDSNGCSPHALNAPVALSAATLRSSHVSALNIFFPSGGGNGAISVPTSGEFAGDTTVSFRSREVVDPASGDLGLNCVSQCPKSGTNLVSSGSLSGAPLLAPSAWGPQATDYTYTFHNGMLMRGGANVDASGASASSMGANQWGLTSGFMVADADLTQIQCDSNGTANTSGTSYCGGRMDGVDVIYQWETGPNQWNKYFGANGITIDPPKALALTAAATFSSGVADTSNNIRGSSEAALTQYNGNKVQLQFSGFGELQGIPGGCVDQDTNLSVQCGQQARWVPAFDMVDGAPLSDGLHTYFVKYLEREMRLSQTSCTSLPLSLTAAAALTLPDSTLVDVNARTTNGAEPTPTNTTPSVVDGVLATGN